MMCITRSRDNDIEFNQKLKRFQLLLNSIATADMNYNQLDAFLKSQMQKRDVSNAFITVMSHPLPQVYWGCINGPRGNIY